MTEQPQPEPHAVDSPTRDIRLPPLPDRAAPPVDEPAGAPPFPTGRTSDRPRLEEQSTDQLAHGTVRPRERTLAFSSPEMGRRPVGPVTVGPSRRWPWVVLVLLPVLVIVGAAIALLLVFQGG